VEVSLGLILDIMYVLVYVAVAIVFLSVSGLLFAVFFPYLSKDMLEKEDDKRIEHED